MSDLTRSTTTPFDALKRVDDRGEHWMARDLLAPTGYSNWQNFQRAINEARAVMSKNGYNLPDHFSLVPVKSAGRTGTDFRLSRTACHFVFLNSDSRKPEIAAAQQYFVIQTQFAEDIQAQSKHVLPQTYSEALRALADSVEDRERAELLQAQAEAERDELKPPAEAWQTLADTGQDYSVREAAYILKRDAAISDRVGPRRLFDWIVDRGMAQRKADGQYVPYAAHSDHLRLAPRSRPDHESGGFKEAHSQLRVTVKGLEWIQQRMRDEGRPDLLGIGARVPTPPSTLPPAMEHAGEGEVVDIHSVRTALMRR
jgi:DNA-damage-inducible protein D